MDITKYILITVFCIAPVLVPLIWLAVAFHNAPLGWEDKTGFHLGVKPRA